MTFLANENFPFPSIKILREKGYIINSIFEKYRGIDDESVLKIAHNESSIILTFDSDYGKLLFLYNLTPPPAVVYFRFKGSNPTEPAIILLEILRNQKIALEGFFTVVEKDGVRQRKLQ